MKRFLPFILLLLLLAGCKQPAPEPTPLSQPVAEEESAPPEEESANVYCGNTQTTLQYCDEFGNPTSTAYTFMAGESVELTDLLRRLNYDPAKVCKCCCYNLTVTTEFGGPYYISFSESYARCQEGQADLTPEQLAMIQKIAAEQCK